MAQGSGARDSFRFYFQVSSKDKSNDGSKVVMCGLKLDASLRNDGEIWGARFISVLFSGFLQE